VLAVFPGIILSSQLTTYWHTSGGIDTATGLPAGITGLGTAEIRGWMKLDEVAAAYQVPVEEIRAQLGIPTEIAGTTQLKELEEAAPDFSTESLRTWLEERSTAGKWQAPADGPPGAPLRQVGVVYGISRKRERGRDDTNRQSRSGVRGRGDLTPRPLPGAGRGAAGAAPCIVPPFPRGEGGTGGLGLPIWLNALATRSLSPP